MAKLGTAHFAGNGDAGTVDGTGAAANFNNPFGAAFDGSGNLFVADYAGCTIRKITSGGVVTTFAGSGTCSHGDGNDISATFYYPKDLVIDSSNNIFVVDSDHVIRKITSGAVVTTFAGASGTAGDTNNNTGTNARFSSPTGIGIDASNNLYVADTGNYTIRKITSAGAVTTLAGNSGVTGSDNGTGATATFGSPQDVVVAGTGDLYVTDASNYTIRKVTALGVVTKIAGQSGVSGGIDATGINARFATPKLISVDPNNNLFVSDDNHSIRKVTLAGVVTTPTGSAADDGFSDGYIYRGLYYSPKAIAINTSTCDAYLADYSNNSIRKITSMATGCATSRRRVMITHLQLLELEKYRKLNSTVR